MKDLQKTLARKLRKNGLSMKDIAKNVKVAKSTVSMWVRDIQLTLQQRRTLSQKGLLKDVIERRRLTRLTKEDARRQFIVNEARKDIGTISKQNLFLIGVGLYWAEGSKTRRGIVEFCNSDSRLIEIMMLFFKKICHVSSERFRGHIHLHPHLNHKKAERY